MIKSQESGSGGGGSGGAGRVDRAHAATLDRPQAAALDRTDPLAGFRDRFVFDPDDEVIYLDGNSLGRMPRATAERVTRELVSGWGARLVRAWDEGWLELPVTVGDRLGEAVLGAAPGEVVLGDSTTVCFYKLCSAALDLRPGRDEIVTDVDNFPTDRYAIEGIARARGLTIRWLEADPAAGPTADRLAPLLSERTALVTFSHVSYRSAHIADMSSITALAHDAGALALWDLSHSAGSIPVALDRDGADLAVGCTYKYLNGGPGAPAYMYARSALQEELRQPIWGWLGHRHPFTMPHGYEPAAGARGLLSGTPPILSLSAVDEGVKLVAEAGVEAIRAKGIALTSLAVELSDARLAEHGVTVCSPRDPEERGAHVALAHADAERLCAGLIERGVVPDFRRPDVIRFGLSPLTTRFVDVWDGVEALRVMLSEARS
jgi:kynureninase